MASVHSAEPLVKGPKPGEPALLTVKTQHVGHGGGSQVVFTEGAQTCAKSPAAAGFSPGFPTTLL